MSNSSTVNTIRIDLIVHQVQGIGSMNESVFNYLEPILQSIISIKHNKVVII
jgi:hypothetical protein